MTLLHRDEDDGDSSIIIQKLYSAEAARDAAENRALSTTIAAERELADLRAKLELAEAGASEAEAARDKALTGWLKLSGELDSQISALKLERESLRSQVGGLASQVEELESRIKAVVNKITSVEIDDEEDVAAPRDIGPAPPDIMVR